MTVDETETVGSFEKDDRREDEEGGAGGPFDDEHLYDDAGAGDKEVKGEDVKDEKEGETKEEQLYAAAANPSGQVITGTGGTGGTGGPGGGPGGAGGTGGTGGTGGGGAGPVLPRSPKFNIYESDQIPKGGMPFSELALEGFKFLGEEFGKTMRTFNNAVMGIFSKPVSSCRVMGETAISLGNKASARLDKLSQKYGTSPNPLWQSMKNTDMEDCAAGQRAMMNYFIDDIAQVGQMNLSDLWTKVRSLEDFRDTGVNLNGVTFYGIDSAGNQSTESLGLKDILMVVRGDATCGGKYAEVKGSEDNGATLRSVGDREKRQLKYMVQEYNDIATELYKQIAIRKYELKSQEDYQDYVTKYNQKLHEDWVCKDVDGAYDQTWQMSNGQPYTASPAQRYARKHGILLDTGLINVQRVIQPSNSERTTWIYELSTLSKDQSLTFAEQQQCRELMNVINNAEQGVKQLTKLRRNATIDSKKKALEKALVDYLNNVNTLRSFGEYGLDTTDPNNEHVRVYSFDPQLNPDLNDYPRALGTLLIEAKANAAATYYTKDLQDAVQDAPGLKVLVDNGLTLAIAGLNMQGCTTPDELFPMLPTEIQTKGYRLDIVTDRALTDATLALNNACKDPQLTRSLVLCGYRSKNEAGYYFQTKYLNATHLATADINEDFPEPDPTWVFETDGWHGTVFTDNMLYNVNVDASSLNLPNPVMSVGQLLDIYKDDNADPGLKTSIKTLLDSNPAVYSTAKVRHPRTISDAIRGNISNMRNTAQVLKDRTKSSMAAARIAALTEGYIELQAMASNDDNIKAAMDAVVAYLSSDDDMGNHLSPGANPNANVEITDTTSRSGHKQTCAVLVDPVKKQTKYVPINASLGDEALFKEAVLALEDGLTYAVGGNFASNQEKARIIGRARRLLGDKPVSKENKIALKLMNTCGWDPTNMSDPESYERFREVYCNDGKRKALDTTMRAQVKAARAALNNNTQSTPGAVREMGVYMDNKVSYMIASTNGVMDQIERALEEVNAYRIPGEDSWGDLFSNILTYASNYVNINYNLDLQDLLSGGDPNVDLDTPEAFRKALVEYLQKLGAEQPTGFRADMERRLDDLENFRSIIKDVMEIYDTQLHECMKRAQHEPSRRSMNPEDYPHKGPNVELVMKYPIITRMAFDWREQDSV